MSHSHSRSLEKELAKRRNIEYEIHHKKQALRASNKRIERIKGESELIVTNHALLRYFERVKGFDMEEVKKEILTEEVLRLHKELGSGKFPNEGFHVVIVNNVVKTVL